AGAVPFSGGTAVDKLIRHARESPRPISEFRGDVPAEVIAVIERMMAKEPDERYRTPAGLADALQPFAVSGPTPWGPQPAPAELPAELQTTPGPAASAGVDVLEGSNDDLVALVPTVGADLSPTPGPISPSLGVRRPEVPQGDRLKLAVLSAVVVVGG